MLIWYHRLGPKVLHPHRDGVELRLHRQSTTLCCSAQPSTPSDAAVSCGVPISSYSAAEALEAVRDKTFGCTVCGKCCSLADDSEVWLNSNEASAIAAHLGISTEALSQQYLQPYQRVPGWWLLQFKVIEGPWPSTSSQLTHKTKPMAGQQQRQVCVFLDAATNACGIYPVRPLQCSTYPWWPEIMAQDHWEAEQRHMCEGIEHPDAPQLDRWHAAQQLQIATQHTLALEAAKPAGWDAQEQLYSGCSTGSTNGSEDSLGAD